MQNHETIETSTHENASPRPWILHDGPPRYAISSVNGRHVAMVSCYQRELGDKEENEANAALIVTAVNTHDRLTAENARLREALEHVTQHAFDDDTPVDMILADLEHMRDVARAALGD